MHCKYIVNSRIYFVVQELFHCCNKDKCRDKIMEQSHHSLKQVHLHEMSFFLHLSFLEELIKSTVPKVYLTEKIQAGSTRKYGNTQPVVLSKSSSKIGFNITSST